MGQGRRLLEEEKVISVGDTISDLSKILGVENEAQADEASEPEAVRCPLRYTGSGDYIYPSIALGFPKLATAPMRLNNRTGVTLDFVLDTGSSINVVNGIVAAQLGLNETGYAKPGIFASGATLGAKYYFLGDCTMGDLPPEERFTFITGITAAVLPIPNPGAAGIIGKGVMDMFTGVAFEWGDLPAAEHAFEAIGGQGTVLKSLTQEPAYITWFSRRGPRLAQMLEGMQGVPIKQAPRSGLPVIELEVNGIKIKALLDTGSPVTIFNEEAAEKCGIDTIAAHEQESGFGRVKKLLDVVRGNSKMNTGPLPDILYIPSPGGPAPFYRSTEKVTLSLGGRPFGDGSRVYVGNVPGMDALMALEKDHAPLVVLGLDVLRLSPRMVLTAGEGMERGGIRMMYIK